MIQAFFVWLLGEVLACFIFAGFFVLTLVSVVDRAIESKWWWEK